MVEDWTETCETALRGGQPGSNKSSAIVHHLAGLGGKWAVAAAYCTAQV